MCTLHFLQVALLSFYSYTCVIVICVLGVIYNLKQKQNQTWPKAGDLHKNPQTPSTEEASPKIQNMLWVLFDWIPLIQLKAVLWHIWDNFAYNYTGAPNYQICGECLTSYLCP